MRLTRLELYGYKSFAARAVFEFKEGITAIVGPNGSGKSNVADAIRWVMGEQSYRLLRADSSSDLIFAGSQNRSRLGMAEVLITLDNSEGQLPLDYTEVTVGRRAYRSGENEYLLNGDRVRLRDITDILSGAGLARSTYTVIGQGMVDRALALRPEARRALFEEAAGIGPHLRKRDDALRRMAETDRNLERVQDILGELEPQARRLRRQAERADEYLLLAQDLRELQRIWYGYHWQSSQRQLAQATAQVAVCESRLIAQRDHLQGLREREEQREAEAATQMARIEELRSTEAQARRLIEGADRQLAVLEERRRLLGAQGEALSGELASLASRRQVLAQEIAETQKELDQHEESHASARVALQNVQRELATVDEARRQFDTEHRHAEKQLAGLSRSVTELRMRLEQIEEQRVALVREAETLGAEKQGLDARRIELESGRLDLDRRRDGLDSALCDAQATMERIGQDLAEQTRRLTGLEKALLAANDEHDRIAASRDLLARMREELTGYLPGVRRVLSSREKLSGILGTVLELMQVPSEYEDAISSALGSRLQDVIVERWEDAVSAIDLLKRSSGGWATFLPLDTVRSGRPLSLQPSEGVRGVASRLVRFDEKLRPVFELLLGHIVVVDDLGAGRELLSSRTGASLYVTMEGEQVRPSGSLSGGKRPERANLLAQEREWRQVPELLRAARSAREDAGRAVAAQRELVDSVRQEQAKLALELERIDHERERLRRASGSHDDLERQTARELEWHATRLERAQTQQSRLDANAGQAQEQMAKLQVEEAACAAALNAVGSKLAELDDQDLRSRVAQMEMRVAVAERTTQSHRRLLASHRANQDQIEQQLAEKRLQGARLGVQLDEIERSRQVAEAERAATEARLGELSEQLAPVTRELRRLESMAQQLARLRTQGMERLHEAEVDRDRANMERERAQERQITLEHEIESELGPIELPEEVSHQLRLGLPEERIELPTVAQLPKGLGDDIRQLRARLRRLGNVNTDAPQEYERLLERQTFLQEQLSDLRGALASLHEIIGDLESIIERDFAAAVLQVDQAFRGYFRRLFSGGEARLTLTDPESLSTSGVDIEAHPPGKRAQGLSLLSGGERALVAVALLFALLAANPVPFCFLDEVDAALDESNVGRFRELLSERAKETQFVVITHNRHTIEASNTIYGISMDESGISQSVSMQVEPGSEPLPAA